MSAASDGLSLGIDLGTTAVKAAVVDAAGKVVAFGSAPTRLITGEGGLVEQDVEEIWLQAVAAVRDALMKGDERVSVSTEIRQMASEAGLSMVDEPDMLAPKETSSEMTEYPMEIRLRGSYHEVGRFLSSLESSRRLISVREVEIDASEASPDRAEVTVLVSVLAWEE